MTKLHIHLDPVGGVAGDMFAGALLDAWPELEPELQQTMQQSGLADLVSIARHRFDDGTLSGSRFEVKAKSASAHHHRSFSDIRELLQAADLATGVEHRALDIFWLLAKAEGQVHGVDPDQVGFHEVGAWDSIADIVTAAWLIDHLDAHHWSSAALPMGSGRVPSAHGILPVPAPATTILLKGFPLYQDGLQGERITPTGAAILRHLQPSFEPATSPRVLDRTGLGFGSKRFEGISNVLRLLAFEAAFDGAKVESERVVQCQFEIDDQTPEDLAVALERLRTEPDVLDVIQIPAFGKKGRMTMQIQLLTRAAGLDALLTKCFTETTPLGIRWQTVDRRALQRQSHDGNHDGHRIRVKHAQRPDGTVTAKAEMDDLAQVAQSHAERQTLRRSQETVSIREAKETKE